MIEPSVGIYQELIKQFYQKAIRLHPNRHQLVTKFTKRRSTFCQPSNTFQTKMVSQPLLNLPSTKYAGSVRSQKSLNSLQSRQLGQTSQQKSERISNQSDFQKSQRNKEQEKYFNCEWIYKATNFKKAFSFAIIYGYLQADDLYSFTKLTQSINTIIEENVISDNSQIKNVSNQWSKLNVTFHKKDKVRWKKILPQTFINFPNSFIKVIFDCLTKQKFTSQQLNINYQLLQSLSKLTKLQMNYFQLFHLQIQKSIQKIGNYKNDLTIGYIKQQKMYVFSNKMPRKSQKQLKKQKVVNNISQAIIQLLDQYDKNTQKLLSLDIFGNHQVNSLKTLLSKKDFIK